jgi:hypothetical protein
MSGTLAIEKQAFEKKEAPAPQTNAPAASQEVAAPSQGSMEERIRIRAYELYQNRASEEGDPESDWYQAEAEIMGTPEQTDH